jgi:hypothetical protein
MMKYNITVRVDRVIGPFVDDALERSNAAPTNDEPGRPKAKKKPKKAVNRRKKPGATSDQAKRQHRKNRR